MSLPSLGLRRSTLALTLALIVTLSGALSGCAMEPMVRLPLVRLAWTTSLYELDKLSYKARETGKGLILEGRAPSGAGLLILPSRDRHIRALDTATREVVWDVETLGANIAAPVQVDDDLIVASLDGRVRRLSIRNGRTLWETEPLGSGGVLEAPTLADGRVFVTATDNRVVALDLEDGKRIWDRRRPHGSDLTITGQAGAVVAGERVITGTSDGLIVAYAVADGATAWTVNLAGDAQEFMDADLTPLLLGDVVIASGFATGTVGLSVSDGSLLWSLPGEATTGAVLGEGTLYLTQANGQVSSVDPKTGRVLWRVTLRSGTPGKPALSDAYLLIPTSTSLVVMERSSGRARASYDDGFGFSATPVVHGGRVFAPANSGRLYVFDL